MSRRRSHRVLLSSDLLKHVGHAKTTMLMHGENDNDVPIAEAERYYVALRDVGVEAIMVRYPREGHGLRESRHVVDSIDRCIAWYVKYFPPARYPPRLCAMLLWGRRSVP